MEQVWLRTAALNVYTYASFLLLVNYLHAFYLCLSCEHFNLSVPLSPTLTNDVSILTLDNQIILTFFCTQLSQFGSIQTFG